MNEEEEGGRLCMEVGKVLWFYSSKRGKEGEKGRRVGPGGEKNEEGRKKEEGGVWARLWK